MIGDGPPGQPAYDIFSIERTFLKSKSGYFTAIGSCSVKMVADRQRHAAYHNKE